MQQTITKDNSITFYNDRYTEHYHSVSGALEEAFEKFARPCRLKDGMKVLDICFGLGYNSLAAISLANVSITALENDKAILEEIKNIEIPADYRINTMKNNGDNKNKLSLELIKSDYEKIRVAADNLDYSDDKIKIKIILGDARETIGELNEKFDAVFLDPFSPKKCPELWTEEFFKKIRRVMKEKGILATYSCAGNVRKNLANAGFKVMDGPIVGRKAPSTIAYYL